MKILVLGAGGAAPNGFARALRLHGGYDLIGCNCSPDDLLLSECDENHVIASAADGNAWRQDIYRVVSECKPDFVHAQNDAEVAALARFRTTVHGLGAHTYLPTTSVIELCRDKWESYRAWKAAGIPVPETQLVRGREAIYAMTGAKRAEAWLRPRVGAGGQQSLKTGNPEVARAWVDERAGWGQFTIAEVLTADTVTVQALYWRGELVCSQQRTRLSWANAGSTTTGVSGSTGIGVTSSDVEADETAWEAVAAVDSRPHGLYGVDMARRDDGTPCPTEINIGRFFTTVPEFYAQAGLSMADLYVRIGISQDAGRFGAVNPLPDGLRWIRGMDRAPLLDRSHVREQVTA